MQRSDVDENVFVLAIWFDKTEAFLGVEPFDRAGLALAVALIHGR